MNITTIKKRNGSIVDFDRSKIERAIEKGFIATSTKGDQSVYRAITDDVILVLDQKFLDARPGVEDIQDVVEEKLIAHGYIDVARAYIRYRAEHQKLREEERAALLERIEQSALKVKKRDGSIVDFDISQIEKAIRRYATGYEQYVKVDELLDEVKLNIYDGISTYEINQALVLVLRSKIEQDPIYSRIAARFLINNLYKKIIGADELDPSFEEKYRSDLKASVERGIAATRLDDKLLSFDFDKLSKSLVLDRDNILEYLGAETLYGRYFMHDSKKDVMELPQHFWMRVAMGIALGEKEEDRTDKAIEFYNAISTLRYVPSTPTLLHSGTKKSQMSSCYLNTVSDDLHNIFKVIGDNAQMSKWSGGIGTDWTPIRAVGSLIESINVESQGVIAFLRVVDATTAAINRSGKRRGATCVYLETWHYEIEDFLELRKGTGDHRRRTHDINTANWIPDLFMKRLREGGEWTLFSPNEVPDLHDIYGKKFEERYAFYEKEADEGRIKLWKRVKADDLWKKMLSMLFSTGHPWITFKDPSNIRSPQDHVGTVHNSNLCTEITLNTSITETAVCNLGSINIMRHINDDRALDKEMLAQTVKTAMRMLDNVVEVNYYPTEEAKYSNFRHRPVGLGIMGLQNAFYKMDMSFESPSAVEFSDELMEFISYHAILTSSELASERGAYETFKGSKWDRGIFPIDTIKLLEEERGLSTETPMSSQMDWSVVRESVAKYGMRNSNCMAIAPTATISNISGCFPSIEPIYKNIYVKSNQAGEFTVINSDLINDLKSLGMWNRMTLELIKQHDGSIQNLPGLPDHIRSKYKEVFEISPSCLIDHAVRRGKWIDQSQSLNIFANTLSGKMLSDIYTEAWQKGLKTTYYLRTLAASQVDKATLKQGSSGVAMTGATGGMTEVVPTPETLIEPEQPVESPVIQNSTKTPSYANVNPQEALVCESCQ